MSRFSDVTVVLCVVIAAFACSGSEKEQLEAGSDLLANLESIPQMEHSIRPEVEQPCILLQDDVGGTSEVRPPSVVFLLGATGGMESEVSASSTAVVPECHDIRNSIHSYQRSIWIVLSEALTGTFPGYWCTYHERDEPADEDFGYPIPHAIPRSSGRGEAPGQVHDGILDEYADKLDFALMTTEPKLSSDQGASGGFSYGTVVAFRGKNINLGVRSAQAPWGAMTPLSSGVTSEAAKLKNELLQQQILATRPYQGLPLSAALDDVAYFLDDTIGGPLGDDSETNCGRAHVVLIMRPGTLIGENTLGHRSSVNVAEDIRSGDVLLHVICLLKHGEESQWMRAICDPIALAGGTNAARLVESDVRLLREALTELLDGILACRDP